MIRYCRQRCTSRCGPIALLNLAKWRGERVTYRDIRRFERLCGWSQKEGTPVANMAKALGWRAERMTFTHFRQHLQAGGVVLLWTDLPRTSETHYCLAIGNDAGRYMLINHCRKHTPCRQHGWQMAYLLRHSKVWTFTP